MRVRLDDSCSDTQSRFEVSILEAVQSLSREWVQQVLWSADLSCLLRFPETPASPETLGFSAQHSRSFHWSGWRTKGPSGYSAVVAQDIKRLLAELKHPRAVIFFGKEIQCLPTHTGLDEEVGHIYGWGFVEFPL